MAAQKPWRDWVYLAVIGLQLFSMLALDLVEFYPKALWEPAAAPLHFLVDFREWHIASSGDPFYGDTRYWFQGLLYFEAVVQLPLAAYLCARLARCRPSSGAVELAALAFGCLTTMGSVVCVSELWPMGPAEVSPDKKPVLLYTMYMPYVVIPGFMAIDMYLRLLPRVQASEKKAKTL